MKSHGKFYIIAVPLIIAVLCCTLFFYKKYIKKNNFSNILLISIDTCRADYLGCYGCNKNTTPNIDMLAKDSFLFENAYTPIPQTLSAHSSMLTGKSPLSHNIHDNLGYQLADSHTTLPEVLTDNGYKTGAIISSFVLDSQFGLDQGFASYNDTFIDVINTANTSERRADEAGRFALKWLEENKNEMFFLFLHFFDPHFRYDPPEPYASKFTDDLYAGEIAFTDYHVGQVIQRLKNLKLYESTLIILVGDHGEMLEEHGEAEHGYFVYQSAMKVPMMIKLPGTTKATRIKETVGLIDIAPTVYSLLDITPPANLEGTDISTYFKNDDIAGPGRFYYCESFTPTKHNSNSLLGVIQENWKYIQTTRPELYNLTDDSSETNNLLGKEPKRARLMKETLKLLIEKHSASNSDSEFELDEAGKKRLESLGYIATKSVDTSVIFDNSKPDPKDIIKFHNIKEYNKNVISLVEQGKLNEAETAYKQLIEHYKKTTIKHSMFPVHFNLATVLRKLEKNEQANKELTATIELIKEEIYDNPNSDFLHAQLGNTYAVMGNMKPASVAFKKALKLNPDLVSHYINLANALHYTNDFEGAAGILRIGIKRMTSQQKTIDIQLLKDLLNSIETNKNSSL